MGQVLFYIILMGVAVAFLSLLYDIGIIYIQLAAEKAEFKRSMKEIREMSEWSHQNLKESARQAKYNAWIKRWYEEL